MATGIVRLGRAAVMDAEWSMAAFQRATDVVGDPFQALGIPSSKIRRHYGQVACFALCTPRIIIIHKSLVFLEGH